jgi:hypothetical protein
MTTPYGLPLPTYRAHHTTLTRVVRLRRDHLQMIQQTGRNVACTFRHKASLRICANMSEEREGERERERERERVA